jgi:pentose-5-phosphate-3-epimerase
LESAGLNDKYALVYLQIDSAQAPGSDAARKPRDRARRLTWRPRTLAWIDRYAEAGSDILTVHRQFCQNVSAALKQIRSRGVQAGLVVELSDPLSIEELHLDIVDRLLVMGTEIGVKGRGLHANTAQRIGRILELCGRTGRRPEIVVDGGIRRETVPLLAQSGADGVVPGSLVFGEPDPRAALHWLFGLDFIAALRRRTKKVLDVHLMLTNTDDRSGTQTPSMTSMW